MDKQLFDDAIGEVPPSTVDVDAAIARGRRAAWTRRVANPVVAVAAGVVLVAGGAVVLTLPGDGDDAVTAAEGQPAGTETAPGMPSCVDQTRFSQALTGALASRGLLPDATVRNDEPMLVPGGAGIEPSPDAEPGDACAVVSATAQADGTGRITVSLAPSGGGLVPETECLPAMGDCATSSGPEGATILGFTSEGAHRVDIVKDDTVVILTAESLQAGVAPPLNRDQLTEIGLDPAFVYP